jgi:hypothetical protein
VVKVTNPQNDVDWTQPRFLERPHEGPGW